MCLELRGYGLSDSEIMNFSDTVFRRRREIIRFLENASIWSADFEEVTSKSYMRGYRDLYQEVSAAHKLLIRMCDGYVKMRIVKIRVREKEQKG